MTDLPYTLTTQRPRQLGMIVLQADETLEADLRTLMPHDVETLVSRIPSGEEVSTDTLRAMEANITGSAALLPRGAQLSAVGYGCTSATAELGADTVARLIRAGCDTPQVTDPVTALIAACRQHQITRLGLISPYVASVSDKLRAALEAAGIQITRFGSFNEAQEANVVRISEVSIEDAVTDMGQHTDCDAVFISCTNLRTLPLIARCEAQIGKPVLSSNLVLAWHLGQLSGFALPFPCKLIPRRKR